MKQQIERFWREEDGITALEYGILAAIILVAVAAFAVYISGQLNPNDAKADSLVGHVKAAIGKASTAAK